MPVLKSLADEMEVSVPINTILILMARWLRISPLLAHVQIMLAVTIAYGSLNPLGWRAFSELWVAALWVVVCSLVVLVTWLTKGKLIKDWMRADPWRQ
ncbi:hypothetical protein [Cucumibacter marinus]|uniref:hypothetical protein n=1 Tax=Cucumibacter marinus TaxID=1121252 RepID=UPI0004902183|nr:hypothetical protein [Cucumibacter marinus]